MAVQSQTEIVQNFRPLAELVPAHWQSGFVQAEDGARIHYTRTGGAKPALLLLHGVQVNGLMWLRTAKALEATYDVVMPDLRGHGQSERVSGLAADTMVNDMIALIRVLDLQNPFVIGHSMGADVAGRLAAAYPVRGVVLVDPALVNFFKIMPQTDETPAYMLPVFEAIAAIKTQPHAERMLTGLRLLPPGTSVFHEEDYVPFVEGQGQFDTAFYRYMRDMGNPLFEDTAVISSINSPMLLLTAKAMMPGVAQAGIDAFTENWRQGERVHNEHVHFENSGHFIPFDQFEQFLEVLQRFLNAH